MKLHYAIKRPGMKYPRIANWCLDIGMIFMICGVIGVGASTMGMVGELGEYAALGGCIIGFTMYSIAIYVSKINVDAKQEPKRLRRVK